jgi:hypothetical protein
MSCPRRRDRVGRILRKRVGRIVDCLVVLAEGVEVKLRW